MKRPPKIETILDVTPDCLAAWPLSALQGLTPSRGKGEEGRWMGM